MCLVCHTGVWRGVWREVPGNRSFPQGKHYQNKLPFRMTVQQGAGMGVGQFTREAEERECCRKQAIQKQKCENVMKSGCKKRS